MTDDPEINRLLNGLLEGSLTPGERMQVRALLQSSAEARQAYYDLVAVDQLLAERYEMPDHIAMQANLMEDEARVTRFPVSAPRGRRTWAWAGGGIAAALAVGWATYSFYGSRQQDIAVVVSPDSHYEVNGRSDSPSVLKAGDTIEVTQGIVSLKLSEHVEATLEGPVAMKLGGRQGRLQLLSGSAYFAVSPGGHGLEITSPAGVIRDVGTRFGVSAMDGGEVETYVDEGSVEIERDHGVKPTVVKAGYSASWGASGAVTSRSSPDHSYVRSLPGETLLLQEGFDREDGAPLNNKAPRLGQRWSSNSGRDDVAPVTRSGHYDSSGAPHDFTARFQTTDRGGSVYLMTFRTLPPASAGNGEVHRDAEERISLRNESGRNLVSLVARASRNQTWQLQDTASNHLSIGTRISALEDHVLTLALDLRNGMARLYDGPSAQGLLLDELKVEAPELPAAVALSNKDGGDLAVDDLEVRMLNY